MRLSFSTALESRLPTAPRKALRPGGRKARVVAVAAQKGGVGKTTTTVCLAAAWARFHGKRVLVVDLDPQAHVTVALCGMVEAGGGALSEVLGDPAAHEVEEIVTSTRLDSLFVTPPDPGLIRLEDRLASRLGKERALRRALEITRSHYDLILLDCPPNVGSLTVNGLVAADHVLIPCAATALAVSGVGGLMQVVDEVRGDLHPELDVLGILLTQVDGRNGRTNAAISDMVTGSWGDVLLPVEIGVCNSLPQAQLTGRDVFEYAPSSRGAHQYRALAACLLDAMGA
jgi:chromosome partitioning protein